MRKKIKSIRKCLSRQNMPQKGKEIFIIRKLIKDLGLVINMMKIINVKNLMIMNKPLGNLKKLQESLMPTKSSKNSKLRV